MSQIDVDYHKKFKKEMEKFKKKCPSIQNDFEVFLQTLKTDIIYNNYTVPTNNKKYYQIAGLDKRVYLPAFVAKAFYCEKWNRGSKSGFRVTFLYDPSENFLFFVEFYFKSKNEVEDKERINRLFR